MVVATNRRQRMWREILRFLKSSLPRALKFLEAAVILSSTSVSSDKFWARYVPRYLNLFVKSTNLSPEMIILPEIRSSSTSSIGLEWAGKYIASVFDFESGVLVQPRWTLTKVVPVIKSALDRKIKVESSLLMRPMLWEMLKVEIRSPRKLLIPLTIG